MATKKKRKMKGGKKTKKVKKTVKTKKTAKKKSASKKARKATRKKVARKPARKKTAPKKRAAAKPKAAAPQPAPAPAPAAPPPGERIGTVTHYYNHLSVAIIQLDSGTLRVGEVVHIKGHTTDFRQQVESMEINHANVSEAHPGDSLGVRVREHAREHDVVYKVLQ